MTRSNLASRPQSALRAAARLSLVAIAVALTGCANTGLFEETASPAPVANAPVVPASPRARVVIAPVIGPNGAVARDLGAQFTQSLERERVAVVAGPPADYTLRGYLVATKDKERTKFSYIWDVMDPAGKRVNRITGDDAGLATQGDVWAAATPTVLQSIAQKASASFVAWLPATPPPAPTVPASASAQPASSVGAPVVATASVPNRDQSRQVVVAKVAGAPGDGSDALSEALRRELSRSGLAVTQAASPSAHRVEGKVIIGKATKAPADKGGGEIQPVQIQWTVKDPKGESLGTVSQKNEIKPGELDGPWGPNADAVAAAAAQGIVKLIEKQTAVN